MSTAEPDLAVAERLGGAGQGDRRWAELTTGGESSPTTSMPGIGDTQPLGPGSAPQRGLRGRRVLDPKRLEVGRRLNRRYRVIRTVGRGGFGVVVLVEDLLLGEEVILKFPGSRRRAADPAVIERLKAEARALRRVAHENVVRTFDLVEVGGTAAVSMEYFPSLSLASRLQDGQVDRRRGMRVIVQVCAGLAAAHRVGVVHCDLKPANVLVDELWRAKVVDFGLAAPGGSAGEGEDGPVVGTPAYMSPEQIRGRAVDERTDVYALGVLMYEVFGGRLPYAGSNSMDVLLRHVEGRPEPPPGVQEGLARVILHAMAVDPEDRPPSVVALRHELEDAAGTVTDLRTELYGW